jgi:hypothetical protein
MTAAEKVRDVHNLRRRAASRPWTCAQAPKTAAATAVGTETTRREKNFGNDRRNRAARRPAEKNSSNEVPDRVLAGGPPSRNQACARRITPSLREVELLKIATAARLALLA